MTIYPYLGPQCTCGMAPAAYPCALHGYPRGRTWTTTTMTYLVCRGRHCAHDWKCNQWTYTTDGA